MSAAPWTPGPWTAAGVEEAYGRAVWGPKDEFIGATSDYQAVETNEANARLIAAAPETIQHGIELAEAVVARVQRGDSVGGEVDTLAHGFLDHAARIRGEA